MKSLPNLLFGVLCLPGDQSHPFAQPTINPLACCICWAGLLGRAVFPPWNEGPNFGSYSCTLPSVLPRVHRLACLRSSLAVGQRDQLLVLLAFPQRGSQHGRLFFAEWELLGGERENESRRESNQDRNHSLFVTESQNSNPLLLPYYIQ